MSAPSVRAFTPMLHVADVLRGAAFYAQLGFEIESRHDDPHSGRPVWVGLQHPGGAELMLVLADGPIDDGVQSVLFYVYCDDVAAMHAHLRALGVAVGDRLPVLPSGRRVPHRRSRRLCLHGDPPMSVCNRPGRACIPSYFHDPHSHDENRR